MRMDGQSAHPAGMNQHGLDSDACTYIKPSQLCPFRPSCNQCHCRPRRRLRRTSLSGATGAKPLACGVGTITFSEPSSWPFPVVCLLACKKVLLIKQVQCRFWAMVSHKKWPISSNSFWVISEELRRHGFNVSCFYQYVFLFITITGPGGFHLINFTPQWMPNFSYIKEVTATSWMLRSLAHLIPLLHAASGWNLVAQKNIHTYLFMYRVQYNIAHLVITATFIERSSIIACVTPKVAPKMV